MSTKAYISYLTEGQIRRESLLALRVVFVVLTVSTALFVIWAVSGSEMDEGWQQAGAAMSLIGLLLAGFGLVAAEREREALLLRARILKAELFDLADSTHGVWRTDEGLVGDVIRIRSTLFVIGETDEANQLAEALRRLYPAEPKQAGE